MTIKPPVAKVQTKNITLHGDTRSDDYFWLREKSSPEVIAYLEAENAYTAAIMQPTENLQETLYQEMLGRIKETDLDVPEKIGVYYYYTRTEQGQNYAIYCRKKDSLEAAEEILLDGNVLGQGHDYFRLGVYKISSNHHLLAYSVDTTGAESYTLYVKDLRTGQLLPDEIPDTYYSVEWANDNQILFYNVLDEAKRPYQLYRHTLGQRAKDDPLIYHETDETFFLSLRKTRSQAYLVLQLNHKNSSELHILNADQPTAEFQIIHPRQADLEYGLAHHNEQFYIITNDQAKNFRVMAVPTTNPAKKNWREFIPHRPEVKVDSLATFQEHLVIFERENGLEKIRITHIPSNETHYVDFPEATYTCRPHANLEFKTPTLRFTYTSMVTPDSIFDYNMNTHTRELKKQKEVLGGYAPDLYQTTRIFATASDGAKVPISLVHKKGLLKNGQNPTLLWGYGSYEISIPPAFNSDRLSLLDRGFVFALAHIRGGGEMGRHWYEQGKMFHKRNTFTDFITCAEHLIEQKYTFSQKLAITGGSAGGLLMGAVVNMQPELFNTVVALVPFVDVINTMLDASIPLTTAEYKEWGNPNIKAEYDYIKSYSPYDNVETKAYPHMLITAGLNDPRVQYWEPAKWSAKLRAMKSDKNTLLLKTRMESGHGGPSGRYKYLRETAFIYAFILNKLNIYE